MAVNIAQAAAAYAKQAAKEIDGGLVSRSQDPGQTFSSLLSDSFKSAIDTGRKAEGLTVDAIAGKAELNDVVTAVANAELTLQAVLAVRDRVIQAYQDIIRMPI